MTAKNVLTLRRAVQACGATTGPGRMMLSAMPKQPCRVLGHRSGDTFAAWACKVFAKDALLIDRSGWACK